MLVAEPDTQSLQRMYAEDAAVVVWWATPIECVSAIARLERDRALTANAVEDAIERLEAFAGSWSEVQPVEPVRRVARRLLRTHPLRAADAFQLAAALAAAESDPSSLPFVSLDDKLSAAARREGFSIES